MPRIRKTLGKKTRKFDEQTFENDFRYPPKPDSYYDVKENNTLFNIGTLLTNFINK